jgi:hypothetical protein
LFFAESDISYGTPIVKAFTGSCLGIVTIRMPLITRRAALTHHSKADLLQCGDGVLVIDTGDSWHALRGDLDLADHSAL